MSLNKYLHKLLNEYNQELNILTDLIMTATENPTNTHNIEEINNLKLQIEYYYGKIELIEHLNNKFLNTNQ